MGWGWLWEQHPCAGKPGNKLGKSTQTTALKSINSCLHSPNHQNRYGFSQVGDGSDTYPGDNGAGAGGDEQEQAEGLQDPAHGAGAGAVSPAPPSSAAAPRHPPYITPSSSTTLGFFAPP